MKMAHLMKEKRDKLKRDHSQSNKFSYAPRIDENTKNIILQTDYSPIQERVI